MSNQRFVLNTGSEIPVLGLNLSSTTSLGCQDLVKEAILSGFKHLHVASELKNEESIGRAIEAATNTGKIKRSHLFVTLTIACNSQTIIEKSLDRSLALLGLEHVDLCLMEWEGSGSSKVKTHIELYKDLESLKRRWKTRAVGVANYSLESLKDLVPHVAMRPSVNRIGVELIQDGEGLVDYCNWNGLLVLVDEFARADPDRMLELPLVRKLASVHKSSPESVLLNWHTLSRRAVLLNSVPVESAVSVKLQRGDIHKLDELLQNAEKTTKSSDLLSSIPRSRLPLSEKAGFTHSELQTNRVLPML